MDHTYDYLLPTCMLRRRSLSRNGIVSMETRGTHLYTDNIFDDTLRALEDDTCSEFSDRSYADARYYTRMKLWNSPFLERQFYSDSEDPASIVKDSSKDNSQFDLSLQQFLEWPDSSGGQESENEASVLPEATKFRRKSIERRKRPIRQHLSSRLTSPYKRQSLPKVVIDSDSDSLPQSEDEDVFKDEEIPRKELKAPEITSKSSISQKDSVKLTSKCNKTVDSDSDYKTYSDTSSERLDSNGSDFHREVDLTSLKSLMSSVLQKSENISNKLSQSKLNHDNKVRAASLTENKNSSGSNKKTETSIQQTGGEFKHFKVWLEKAQESLSHSEKAVQCLQLQLEDGKCFCGKGNTAESDDKIQTLQNKVEDLQRQLDNKTKECDNRCSDILTVARQLDVVEPGTENTSTDMLDKIIAEIKLLQSINAAVNPAHLSTISSIDKPTESVTDDTKTFRNQSEMREVLNLKIPDADKDRSTKILNSQSALPNDKEDHMQRILELTSQVEELQKTLTATEETVHCQTHKMKNYRNILIENGLLQRSRSNSVPSTMMNFNSQHNTEQKYKPSRRASLGDRMYDRRRSISPTSLSRRRLTSHGVQETGEDLLNLRKENSKLRFQINRLKSLLRSSQGRSPTSDSDLDVLSGNNNSQMPPKYALHIVKNWIDMVEKYLTDIDEYYQPVNGVAKIREGFSDVKTALLTISKICTSAKEGSTNGLSILDGNGLGPKYDESKSNDSSRDEMGSNSSQNHICGSRRGSCNGDGNRESGSLGAGTIPSCYLQKQQKVLNTCCRNSDNITGCCECSKICAQTPNGENWSVSRNAPQFVPKIIIKNCNRHDKHETNAFEIPDFEPIAESTDRSTEVSEFTYSIKTNQFRKRCFEELMAECKGIEETMKDLRVCKCSLDKIIDSYEEQIREPFRPDTVSSFQKQLHDLYELRTSLDGYINRNESLENVMHELKDSSESITQNLETELKHCHIIIQEQNIELAQKDSALKEANEHKVKCRDNSCKIQTELNSCKERVASLEKELQSTQATTKYNQQDEIKIRHDNTYSYKEMKPEVVPTISKLVNDIPALKTNMDELEVIASQWTMMESKYKTMLAQASNKVKQLISELEATKEKLKLNNLDTECLKVDLENARDTIEEQSAHLCDKTKLIDNMNSELKKRNIILREQDSLCRELTTKLDSLNKANEKLSSQLELTKHKCEDYKQQNDQHDKSTQEMRDQIAKLKAELTLTVQLRKSQEKLMMKEKKDLTEAKQLKDKHLYNLKVTYRELTKAKKDFRDKSRKLEEVMSTNRSLQTEVKVRERLMEKKGESLTDDVKQGMITDLLNELRVLREQVITVQDQNKNMKAKLILLNTQPKDKVDCKVDTAS
ncbi:hypothetical protein ACF0H5_021839 [Mactra antiquata]